MDGRAGTHEVGRTRRKRGRELIDRLGFAELGEHTSTPPGQMAAAEKQERELWVCRLGGQQRARPVERTERAVPVASRRVALCESGCQPRSHQAWHAIARNRLRFLKQSQCVGRVADV